MSTSLESRNYVATDSDIEALAKAYAESLDSSNGTRTNYLRALVATTQAELGAKPRLRSTGSDAPTLEPDGVKAQLMALEDVHSKFYEIVLSTVGGSNADERNRRSNFARSAMSTVRAYVRSGFDVTLLAAARVTKAALAAAIPENRRSTRAVSAAVLRRRADKALSTLSKIGDALAKADRAQAVEILQAAIDRLSGRLAAIGKTQPVTDAKRAVRERVPLKTKVGTFHPVGRSAH